MLSLHHSDCRGVYSGELSLHPSDCKAVCSGVV